MKFCINKSLPITTQIFEQVCLMIIKDNMKGNHKLSSVREFAIELGVNPNTVQKSYELLESSNVIYSVRGSGWYVSEDVSIAKEVVNKLVKKKVLAFIDEMEKFGITKEDIVNSIKEGKNFYE